MAKYFPPSKSAKFSADITNFAQYEHESLYEAWEHFQDLIRRCPHHGFPVWQQIQMFYNGLSSQNRSSIDAAWGGSICKKTPEKAYALIEEMAANNYQWPSGDRHVVKRPAGVYQVESSAALELKLEAITKKLETLMQAQTQSIPASPVPCDHCGMVGHESIDCQVGNPFAQPAEEAKYVGNSNRN